jgi:hypothetical protein
VQNLVLPFVLAVQHFLIGDDCSFPQTESNAAKKQIATESLRRAKLSFAFCTGCTKFPDWR